MFLPFASRARSPQQTSGRRHFDFASISCDTPIDLLHEIVRQVTMSRPENETNGDRLYIERLLNKRVFLAEFAGQLFSYNSADIRHRAECIPYVTKCPFAKDGPHRFVRLSLHQSTVLVALLDNGFAIERGHRLSTFAPQSSRQEEELFSCSTYVACKYCRARLFNAHMLNLVLFQRTDLLFQLLQRHRNLMTGGVFPVVNLQSICSERSLATVRQRLNRQLRKMHKSNCIYLDRAFNQELLDQMSANLLMNNQLTNRCETCLVSLIEHDVLCNLQLADLVNVAEEDEQPEENEEGNNECEPLRCKCCLSKRAKVNIPCGHVFQCSSCEKMLRATSATSSSTFSNAPCPVCRSPVILTTELYV